MHNQESEFDGDHCKRQSPLSSSSFLYYWSCPKKRLFPFNVPIAIILVGFCYMLFFLTFTIGWIGALGMFGFLIAFLIGVVLMISYAVSNRRERRKTMN